MNTGPGFRGACHRARIRATRWLIRATDLVFKQPSLETVIASEAKQSMVRQARKLDCFAEPVIGPRLARTRWLAMTLRHDDAISPHAFLREVLLYSRPLMKGRRECRAPDAPAASRAIKNKAHERSHHRSTGFTRHSPRNGFTASFVLFPVTGLVCHRRLAGIFPRDLTPASGRQNHTTSPSASGTFVHAPSASTASRPAL